MFIELENSRHIPASVTIIGRRPNRQHCFVKMPFITFHHELMCSANNLYIVLLTKTSHNVRAE